MLLYAPTICWQRCISYSMYSQSCQLQGRLTQRVALWNTSCSQTVRNWSHAKIGLVGFSVKKSIKSSNLQNTTSFVNLGRQLQHRQSMRGIILNGKFDIPSHQKFSSASCNLGSMPRKVGVTASGLGFARSVMANDEGPVDNTADGTQPTESSTYSAHGKKVYTDYSVIGIPGDGRCLFRSVAHGACIRSGKPIPNEDLQRRLLMNLSRDEQRLNSLLKETLICMSLRLGSHMCGEVSQSYSWLHMFFRCPLPFTWMIKKQAV